MGLNIESDFQDEVCGFRPIRLVSWNRSTIREMPPVFGAFALIGGSCPIQVRADIRDGYDLIVAMMPCGPCMLPIGRGPRVDQIWVTSMTASAKAGVISIIS